MGPTRTSVEFLILSIAIAILLFLRLRPVKKDLRNAVFAAGRSQIFFLVFQCWALYFLIYKSTPLSALGQKYSLE